MSSKQYQRKINELSKKRSGGVITAQEAAAAKRNVADEAAKGRSAGSMTAQEFARIVLESKRK